MNSLINVIICDDDKVFADELGKKISIILSGSNIKAKIQVFDMAEKIGSEVLKSCDIAFLDIRIIIYIPSLFQMIPRYYSIIISY